MSHNTQLSLNMSNVTALALSTQTLGIKQNLGQILKACYEAKANGKQALFCGELSVTGCDCQDMFLSPGFIKRVKREVQEFIKQIPEDFIVGLGLPLYLGETVLSPVEPFNPDLYDHLIYQVKDQAAQACDIAQDQGGQSVDFVASEDEKLPDAEKVAQIVRNTGTTGFFSESPEFSLQAQPKLLVNTYTILARDKVVQTISSKLTTGAQGRTDHTSQYFATGRQLEKQINPNTYLVEWQGQKFVIAMGQLKAVKSVLKQIPALVDTPQDISFIVLPQAHAFCATENDECVVSNATALALEFKVPVIQVNNLGTDGGSSIYDGRCFFVSAQGAVVGCNQRFSSREYELVDDKQHYQAAAHIYDNMLHAVALGIFDWMKKTRSKGFALSLSGGADSALCATCVGLAQIKALLELGLKDYVHLLKQLNVTFDEESFVAACKVAGEGPYADKISRVQLEVLIKALHRYIMPHILVCVYQASKHSGTVTFTAAKKMCECIGGTFYQWSIAPMVDQYVNTVNDVLGYELNWHDDDIALQNIQARSRLPGIWLMANHMGFLLLATSNLSEAAVGYCTMDGDTAGGVSPIAGIGKSVILKMNERILHEGIFLNGHGLFYKVPAIKYIVAQAPTAELRPDGNQTDERDLMPYPLLDVIRQMFVIEGLLPDEIAQLLISKKNTTFAPVTTKLGLQDEDIKCCVRRFFALFQRNQWKRERFATGFRIEYDDASPKSFLRFPVLNVSL